MKKLWIGLVLLGGCPLLFVEGPGNWTPATKRAPVCDDEATMPIVGDVLIGVFGAVALGTGIDGVDGTGGDDRKLGTPERTVAIGVGVVALATATISIATGLSRTRRCRAAQNDWLVQER